MPPDDLDDLIELALQERIDPAYGFELLLNSHGTCNSITVYDSQLANAGTLNIKLVPISTRNGHFFGFIHHPAICNGFQILCEASLLPGAGKGLALARKDDGLVPQLHWRYRSPNGTRPRHAIRGAGGATALRLRSH